MQARINALISSSLPLRVRHCVFISCTSVSEQHNTSLYPGSRPSRTTEYVYGHGFCSIEYLCFLHYSIVLTFTLDKT